METRNESVRTLWINGTEYSIGGIDELRRYLLSARQLEFSDIWIELDHGKLFTLMANDGHAWIMVLRHRGDIGLNSRNLGFTGPIDAKLEFMHDTGERKHYPLAWVISADDAFSALEYFYEHGEPSPAIAWHDSAVGHFEGGE